MELRGRKALITGGAVRIGRVISETLAQQGCEVIIHCRSSVRDADRLVDLLRESGAKASVIEADLTTERGCYEVMEKAWSRTGGLDFLINNAAVYDRDPLAKCSEEKLLNEMRINLFAPILLTREFAAKAERGKVINLLDRRIAAHPFGAMAYTLAKKALAEFTQLAAVELAPGITVNGVAPGVVLPPPGMGEAEGEELCRRVEKAPLKRRPTPLDVAEAVVYLLKADAVTGQILFVDAGQHLMNSVS